MEGAAGGYGYHQGRNHYPELSFGEDCGGRFVQMLLRTPGQAGEIRLCQMLQQWLASVGHNPLTVWADSTAGYLNQGCSPRKKGERPFAFYVMGEVIRRVSTGKNSRRDSIVFPYQDPG